MRAAGLTVRLAILTAALAATAVFLLARPSLERVPQRAPLAGFPAQVGSWQSRENAIPKNILEMLGPGDFLSRIYTREQGSYIDFFIAYFPTQKRGDTIHSPRNCLPGAGWTFIESRHEKLAVAGHPPVRVNRAVIAKGLNRQLVLYWYQAHGRTVSDEYLAKFYAFTDAIRLNRTDGALIRITTPLQVGEDASLAWKRVDEFARQIVPDLNRYIPD